MKTVCILGRGPSINQLRKHDVSKNDEFIMINNHSKTVSDSAKDIAIKIATNLDLVGLLAIELFELNNQELLVNEIAPRPHNSGHWTMDGCITDQFEQAARAALGMNLGSVKRIFDIEMKNLIGKDIELARKYFKKPNYRIHIYGKKDVRQGRKMGHINKIIKS